MTDAKANPSTREYFPFLSGNSEASGASDPALPSELLGRLALELGVSAACEAERAQILRKSKEASGLFAEAVLAGSTAVGSAGGAAGPAFAAGIKSAATFALRDES